VPGLGPGFPDKDARRVEGAMQDQRMAVSRFAGRPRQTFQNARPSGPDASVERRPFRIELVGQRHEAAAASVRLDVDSDGG
jgi:hypothetical protein